MLGSAGEKRGRKVRFHTKAGVGAQIHRSHTLCYISGCHRCREKSPGSEVFESIIHGNEAATSANTNVAKHARASLSIETDKVLSEAPPDNATIGR